MKTRLLLLVPILLAHSALNATPVYLVSHSESWRYHKGTNAPQSDWKTVDDAGLNSTAWPSGNGGFGYANNGGVTSETNNCHTIVADMYNNYTTLYYRREFTLQSAPDPAQKLYLRMDWDDGFIAWLDGRYLMQKNSPNGTSEPAFASLASGDHESSLGNNAPNPAEVYDLGYATNWLTGGAHTLSLVGLNGTLTSSDLIQVADLYADAPPPPVTNVWAASSSPIVMTTNVTIPANTVLVIEPGVTVQFAAGVRVVADGQVLALGTPEKRIRFTRSGTASWSGFSFSANHQTNLFAYVDFEYANGAGNGGAAVVYINDSQVTFERDTFLNISGNKYMDIWYPQVRIGHSVFGDVGGSYMFTIEDINPDGWFVVDGNLFGTDTGDSDIFHLNHVSLKDGPKAIVVNNVFTGAGDDIIDDNETDTHIEGNLFMNFTTNHPPRSASAAVTTGEGSGNGHNLTTQHLTVVRNVFWGNDYGILNKDGSYVQVYNCVFVNNRGALIFDEPWRTNSGTTYSGPGRGCYIESSIFWRNWPENGEDQGTFAYLTNQWAYRTASQYQGATQVTVNRSLLPAQFHYLGAGNIDAEPLFVYPTNTLALSPTNPAFANGFDGFVGNAFLLTNHLIPDVHLLPGSAAVAAGWCGADMGVHVSNDATVSGEPPSPTPQTNAALLVAGLDIAGYKYRLAGPGFTNAWSEEMQQLKYVSQTTVSGTRGTATSTNHGYRDGDVVQVFGADALCPYYNGTFAITNVTANTFAYTVSLGTNAALNEPIQSYAEKRTDIWCCKPQAVELSGLTDGTYHLEALRKNTLAIWQDATTPTLSKTWTVMTRPLAINSLVCTNASAWMRFYAVAGQGYGIEFTDGLAPVNWQPLCEVAASPTNGEQVVVDPATPAGSRFYRARVR